MGKVDGVSDEHKDILAKMWVTSLCMLAP